MSVLQPNENKMSDGGRERASLGVKVWKSFQKWSAQRSAVRSIAWLGPSAERTWSLRQLPHHVRLGACRDIAGILRPDRRGSSRRGRPVLCVPGLAREI